MLPGLRANTLLLTIVVPAALVAAALRLELWLAPRSSADLIFLMFSPVVALSALAGGIRAGATALLLSAVAIDYCFFAPGDLFGVADASEALALTGFVVLWLPITFLTERMHRAYRRGEALRAAAARSAAQADRLEQLTAALAKAVQPEAAIEASVQEAAHWLRATAACLLVADEQRSSLELARAIGYSDEDVARMQRVPLSAAGPLQDAFHRRAPVILETAAARRADYPGQSDPEAADGALIALPLTSASGVIAVLRLDFPSSVTLDAEDRDFLAQLAPRAALALDRTRQFDLAQRARGDAERLRRRADEELQERLRTEQALRASETRYRALAARTSRLHSLTASLSEAITVEAVARAVVTRARTAVGATGAEVARLMADTAVLDVLAAEPGPAASQRVALDEGSCATEAIRTAKPIFAATFEELQQRYWRSAAAAADGGYVSAAVLPLLADGGPIGVLSFYFTVPVNFDDEYQALLISVAQHCAQALDRARLYESAQRARAEAETANRLKDDFLSIVSHDLRTPLTSILGWTTILQKPSIDTALASRARQAIRDNAERQAKLIDDLLDFSRITAGRLVLERRQVDLQQLLRGVIEAVLPTAATNRVELRYGEIVEASVMGDARRLEQVFLNLLGNALKFTPEGGIVELHARLNDGAVEVSVTDTGVGIDPDFAPHVFERFRQDHSAAERPQKGVGLGLSIARQLVEAHGGSIRAQSEGRGRGATFIVRLPVLTVAPKSDRGQSSVVRVT